MKRSKMKLLIIIWLVLSIGLSLLGYHNFSVQRDEIVNQQSNQLLLLADNVSGILERYFDEHLNALWLLSQGDVSDQAIFERYMAYKRHDILGISMWSVSGDIIEAVTESRFEGTLNLMDAEKAIKTKKSVVSKAVLYEEGRFIINQIQPIVRGDVVTGLLVQTIDLNQVYQKLVLGIKPGNYGYVLVKSVEGVIIMHPVQDQIGSNSLSDRRIMYPNDDWSELELLFNKQLTERRGTHVYHSKWWQGNRVEWNKKVSAFTSFTLEENDWIISVQMDYDEIASPIREALLNTIIISAIVLILLTTMVASMLISDRKQRLLSLEAKHHQELSDSWQALVNSEERLRHAQKLETLGTLTSGIAHEFNNLLTPILGHSEIAMGSIDPSVDGYDNIKEIHHTAEDAKTIIEQLLRYTRTEESQNQFITFNLNDVIRDCHKLIRPIFPTRIKMDMDLCDDAYVFGHHKQIQQVLINLITNAAHAIGSNEGRINIRVDMVEDNIVCCVTDNGAGMTPETLEKIFEPYFTTKPDTQGSGLGLYIVKHIMASHGGSIEAISSLGRGSTFSLYFPKP